MPRVKRRGHVLSMLTLAQTLELILGPSSATAGAFADDSERRAAWTLHRDELMDSVNEFFRPWAFWAFEVARVPGRANGGRQPDVLSALRLLTDRERAMLAGNSIMASMLKRERQADAKG